MNKLITLIAITLLATAAQAGLPAIGNTEGEPIITGVPNFPVDSSLNCTSPDFTLTVNGWGLPTLPTVDLYYTEVGITTKGKPVATTKKVSGSCKAIEGAIEGGYDCDVNFSEYDGYKIFVGSIGGSEQVASLTYWNSQNPTGSDGIPLKCVEVINL